MNQSCHSSLLQHGFIAGCAVPQEPSTWSWSDVRCPQPCWVNAPAQVSTLVGSLEMPASGKVRSPGLISTKESEHTARMWILSATSIGIKVLWSPVRLISSSSAQPSWPELSDTQAVSERNKGAAVAMNTQSSNSAVSALPAPSDMPDGSLDIFPFKGGRVILPHFLPTILF